MEKDAAKKREIKLIGGFLSSSLDIEDDMSFEVYAEFLERENWPAQLNEDSFQIIKNHLLTLIQETEEHKKAFLNLQRELK